MDKSRWGTVVGQADKTTLEQLCCTYHSTRDRGLRDWLIGQHGWLVRVCALQVRHHADSNLDDLMQVGQIGLIKALERFEPAFGVLFATFASATIKGEIRHHYRGRWTLKTPRSLQERHQAIQRAIDVLTEQNQQSPTVKTLAAYLEVDQETVLEALAVGRAASHTPVDDMLDAPCLGCARGEKSFEGVELSDEVSRLLQHLPHQQRTVLFLRFCEGQTQQEIASQLGISQVQVSRLMVRGINTLRARAATQDNISRV